MSNINTIILESNNKLPTVGDVGAGYGKEIGSYLGGPIGYGIGYLAGREFPENPNKQMDKKKRLHRLGAMLNNRNKLKNILITGLGAAAGAALGGAGHQYHAGKRPKFIGKARHDAGYLASTGGGAALGAALAHHLFGAGRDNRHLAKKLGYGKFGQIGASVTPYAGLFHPHSQKDD